MQGLLFWFDKKTPISEAVRQAGAAHKKKLGYECDLVLVSYSSMESLSKEEKKTLMDLFPNGIRAASYVLPQHVWTVKDFGVEALIKSGVGDD